MESQATDNFTDNQIANPSDKDFGKRSSQAILGVVIAIISLVIIVGGGILLLGLTASSDGCPNGYICLMFSQEPELDSNIEVNSI